MGVEDAADLAAMFDDDDFGVTAEYTAAGAGIAVEIKGIFDDDYNAALAPVEALVATSTPQIMCRTSDVPDAAGGDSITIGATTFDVVEVRPDGTGITTLILNRQ